MRDAAGKAYRAGDYELARRLFVRAVALDPTDAQLHGQLGCTLLKLGSADSARAEFTASGSKPNCS
jgi:Flp pilus assembly protein TadD